MKLTGNPYGPEPAAPRTQAAVHRDRLRLGLGPGARTRTKALWQSPLGGLIWTLVRTDFKTRYHGTLGGFVWALLKPLAMFLVLLGIFSFIFAADPNYKLNLIIGLFLWDFFSEATKTGLGSLHAKRFLVTKAKFPSWVLVVASSSNAAVTLAVFSLAIVAFLSLFHQLPSPEALLLFFLYQLLAWVIVVAFSLASSVLFLRYRDLNQVWEVVLQAGFFIAPIIYPLGILPERFHIFLFLWPPTPIIQFSRSVMVEGVIPTTEAHLSLAAATACALALGILVYRRYQARAAEYL